MASGWKSSSARVEQGLDARPVANLAELEIDGGVVSQRNQPKMSLTRSKNGFSRRPRRRPTTFVAERLARAPRSECFCSFESFFGIATRAITWRSPWPRPETFGMPLPRSLNRARRPACRTGSCTSSSTVERRHLDRCRRARASGSDRHLAIEIVFLAMEERVLLHVHDDVEIAGGPPALPCFAFAIEAQPLAGRDAGGNLDRRACARAPMRPAPRQVWHGLAIVFPVPRQFEHGARDGEEALLIAQLAGAPALRARLRAACRRRAGAAAALARLFARNLDRRLGARRGLLERDLEVVAEIRAALRTAARAGAPPKMSPKPKTSPRPEKMSEKSAKIVGSNPAPPVEPLTPAWPKRSCRCPLLLVSEHGMRLGRFLEALLGLVVSGIAVGVILQRELSVGALDLPIRALPLDARGSRSSHACSRSPSLRTFRDLHH